MTCSSVLPHLCLAFLRARFVRIPDDLEKIDYLDMNDYAYTVIYKILKIVTTLFVFVHDIEI